MADFCKGCSVDMFGSDTKDLAGLITQRQFEVEKLAAPVICEGCDAQYVDHSGERVKPSDNFEEWVHY